MIRSMSGFGRGEAKSCYGKILIEIKSLNHRYFEFSPRLPNHLSVLENKIKKYVHQEVSRGKVNFYLQYEKTKSFNSGLNINKEAALNYYRLLTRLKKHLKLDDDIRLDQIISSPDVIIHEKSLEDIDKLWLLIKRALTSALKALIIMRKSEGKSLKCDLVKRLGLIEKALSKIKEQSGTVINKYRAKLKARIKELSGDPDMVNKRIASEIAIFAERSDITEELVRMKAHLSAFRKRLSSGKEAGRTMDFIIQEMSREINTISAKAGSYNISKQAILVKNELEKIREQAQNIE